jgi:hypothetical protein
MLATRHSFGLINRFIGHQVMSQIVTMFRSVYSRSQFIISLLASSLLILSSETHCHVSEYISKLRTNWSTLPPEVSQRLCMYMLTKRLLTSHCIARDASATLL